LQKLEKELKEEIQKLRDEITRLKGYNPKPRIKPAMSNDNLVVPQRRRENLRESDE
jgi:hypothetical protein